jgi:hypothetical protein
MFNKITVICILFSLYINEINAVHYINRNELVHMNTLINNECNYKAYQYVINMELYNCFKKCRNLNCENISGYNEYNIIYKKCVNNKHKSIITSLFIFIYIIYIIKIIYSD